MKKISVFILTILLCLTFIGCEKSQATEDTQTVAVQESQTQAEQGSETESGDKIIAEKEESSASKENNKTEKEKNSDKQDSSSKEEEKTTEKSPSSQNNAENNTEKAKETTTAKTTSSSTVTCYVTIEYTAILDNMDKLKEGHEKYVNQSGYALSKEKVTVKNGSSAYQAVKTACDNNGIKVSTTGSGKKVYISGFGNIDEKDCGSASGWTYYVNGYFPPKSCGAYTVSNGDEIRFLYVVESK